MRAVYKYPLLLQPNQKLNLPMGVAPLHVDMQGGAPTLWAMVDTEAMMVERTIYIRGTGHLLENDANPDTYIGTIMDGAYVWHVFLAPPVASEQPPTRDWTLRAARLADACQDAYSFDNYGEDEWRRCAQILLDRGYTDAIAEAILRSKHMRWLRDQVEVGENVSAQDLVAYLNANRNGVVDDFK